MKILLRHLGGMEDGTRKEYVELVGVPSEGDEIHWAERILKVLKVMWFPGPNEFGPVACLYVQELS